MGAWPSALPPLSFTVCSWESHKTPSTQTHKQYFNTRGKINGDLVSTQPVSVRVRSQEIKLSNLERRVEKLNFFLFFICYESYSLRTSSRLWITVWHQFEIATYFHPSRLWYLWCLLCAASSRAGFSNCGPPPRRGSQKRTKWSVRRPKRSCFLEIYPSQKSKKLYWWTIWICQC